MPNILPQLDSSTQHVNDKGKPTKDFTNWLKSISDYVNKAAQSFTSLVVGSPTGGNKGDGSINATTLYLNGTALGTAATQNVGTAANNVVQLNASAQLPAVSGALLTGLTGRLVAGTPLVLSPFTINSATTQAHGLGVSPVYVEWLWTCLTGNLNYSAGDTLLGWPNSNPPMLSVDATNLVLRTQSTNPPVFINKTTLANAAITAADWSLTLTPYKLG